VACAVGQHFAAGRSVKYSVPVARPIVSFYFLTVLCRALRFRCYEWRVPAVEGFTIWLTGLPCSGKSTVAALLADGLRDQGRRVEILDGDVMRRNLSHGLSFSREDRDRNVRRVGFVANLLSRNGVVAVVAVVSPYRVSRNEVRCTIQRFVEVHVDCPLSECERRDVKGMYKKARAGTLPGFTGVGDPYERPEAPEVTLRTHRETVEESVGRVMEALCSLGYIPAGAVSPARAERARERVSQFR
jgi:adenylylsulfate kinase